MKKLMFLHHLSTFHIFEVQKKLNLPGLFQECQEFMIKFDITKVESFSPIQWKNLVKKKIEEMNKIDILNQMKKSKKMKYEKYVEKDFKRQAYLTSLNLADARLRFKINAFMTPTVKMNFPSDEEFASQLWSCSGCGNSDLGYELAVSRDTQQHKGKGKVKVSGQSALLYLHVQCNQIAQMDRRRKNDHLSKMEPLSIHSHETSLQLAL